MLHGFAGSYSGGSASGSAGQSSSGPPAGPTASAVVNLGVIGRGSKRINVQPVAAGTSHAGTEATGEQSISGMGQQSSATHVISMCRRDWAPC